MKRIRKFMLLAAVCLSALATPTHVLADTTSSTERWKGTKIEDLKVTEEKRDTTWKKDFWGKKTDEVESTNTTGEIKTLGTRFCLYNVGTGKFIIADGEWGEEATLLYQDFGAVMTLGYSTAVRDYYDAAKTKQIPNLILSGLEGIAKGHNSDNHPYALGINYPDITTNTGSWKNHSDNIYGPYLKAHPEEEIKDHWYRRSFQFIRVETDENATTNTYYIKENVTNVDDKDSVVCWLGAVAGRDVYSDDDATQFVGNNSCTFTEKQNDWVKTNTKLYQWRFVTLDEMMEVANAESGDNYGGLLSNVSFLVKDPYFDRKRSAEFKSGWKVNSTVAAKTEGQNHYIWMGNHTDSPDSLMFTKDNTDVEGSFNKTTIWNAARLHKVQFDTSKNGKYAFALFEGEGTATQKVDSVPATGYYMVTLNGVSQGSGAKLKVTGSDTTEEVDFPNPTSTLTKASFNEDYTGFTYFKNKSDYDKNLNDSEGTSSWTFGKVAVRSQSAKGSWTGLNSIGQELYTNRDKYSISVVVRVNKDAPLTITIDKLTSTPQEVLRKIDERDDSGPFEDWSGQRSSQEYYYYDTDIVAFDNVNIYYLGQEAPFLLHEETGDTTYIKKEFSETYPATYTDQQKANKRKNGNVVTYLKRTFTEGKWNSLVLPINMTAAQVLEYFGENTQLARLDGVNTVMKGDNDPYYIDFKTVPLKQKTEIENVYTAVEGNVIEAGQFYIIKPYSAAGDKASVYKDLEGNGTVVTGNPVTKCYMIGRHDYVNHDYVDPAADYHGQAADGSARDGRFIFFKGTYKYITDENYGPQPGDYIFSGGDMWHISKKYTIKAFRGWLGARDEDGNARELTFGFNDDDTPTSIDGVMEKPAAKSNRVYNVNGQLVRSNSSSTEGLPSGIYMVNGKKVIVK